MKRSTTSSRADWNRVYQTVQRYYRLYLYQHQLLDVIRLQYDSLENKRILELGCGKGNELVQLAREGARCFGADFSEIALTLLDERRRQNNLDIELVRADARALPFIPHSFDLTFSQGVLEHFHDPGKVLREQHRILRDDGYLVVEVPNKWTLYTVTKRILMYFGRWGPGWETEYSPRELKMLLEEHGFKVTDLVGWDFLILRAVRKIGKMMGLREQPENRLIRRLRTHFQRNSILLNFFLSITAVARKVHTTEQAI